MLALLTLFTIVGVSFVLYADSAANQARANKDSNTNFRPDIEPGTAVQLDVRGQLLGGRVVALPFVKR